MYHPDVCKDPNPKENAAHQRGLCRHIRRGPAQGVSPRLVDEPAQKQSKDGAEPPESESRQVLDEYFRCLLQENWPWHTEPVRQGPEPDTFDRLLRVEGSGQGALSDGRICHQVFPLLRALRGGRRRIRARGRYIPSSTDRDNRTGRVSEEAYTKYVVWNRIPGACGWAISSSGPLSTSCGICDAGAGNRRQPTLYRCPAEAGQADRLFKPLRPAGAHRAGNRPRETVPAMSLR